MEKETSGRPPAGDVLPIGRDAEMGRISRSIDATLGGGGSGLVISGPAGLGKTTLLRWAVAQAGRTGLVVASARVPRVPGLSGDYLVREISLSLIDGLRARGRPVPELLFRVLDEGVLQSDRVPTLASAWDRVGPAGVFVDDVHWATDEVLEMLVAVCEMLETPFLLVLATREAETLAPWHSGNLAFDELHLSGLSVVATEQLAQRWLRGPALPSLTGVLHGLASGNPLFTIETLRLWDAQGLIVQVAGYWRLAPDVSPPAPLSLRQTVGARLGSLDDAQRSMLRTLALLGRPASIQELRRMTQPAQDAVRVLSQLESNGVASLDPETPATVAVSHPIYAQLALDEMSSSERGLIHDRILLGLSLGVPTYERVHHALRASTPPDDLESLLTRAAVEAQGAGSFRVSASLWKELAARTTDRAVRAHALHRQGAAAHHFDPRESIVLLTDALDLLTDPAARANALLGRSEAHRKIGDFDPAYADLLAAEGLATGSDRTHIRLAMGVLHVLSGDPQRGERVFENAATDSRGTAVEWSALNHLAVLAVLQGDLIRGRDLMRRILEDERAASERAFVIPNLAGLEVLLGRWDQAQTLLEEGLARADAAVDRWKLLVLLSTAAGLEAWRGRTDVALDHAVRARDMAVRLGNPAFIVDATEAMAQALLEGEKPSEAVACILGAGDAVDAPQEVHDQAHSFIVFGSAFLEAGDRDRAADWLERARGYLESAPHHQIAADRLAASIMLAEGDTQGAIVTCERWADAPVPVPFHRARLLEVQAAALLAARRRHDSVTAAERALQIFRELGAERRVHRLDRWLEQHRPGKAGRPRSVDRFGLTPRERQVLDLIVRAKTNKEIARELGIAPGTVKRHVENLLAKTGVRRRMELRDLRIP